MRFGKITIGLLTVILLGLMFVVSTREELAESGRAPAVFSVSVESSGKTEWIQSWEDDERNIYIFLPSYARLEQAFLISGAEDICIDGVSVTDRKSCEDYELNQAYAFSCTQGGESHSGTVTFVRSGGVPSLYIDVSSGSMDYIHLEKGNEETGTMRLYSAEGKQLYTGNLASVKGRGNTSWYAEKKPYSLTLDQEADLLGMGAAQRWILLTETLRNKIVYDFAAAVGMPYSPKCEWVDLYLNGEYAGLYLLSERNEVHPERVDIAEEGSFLVSVEYESRLQKQKYPYVITESGQALRIHYGTVDISQLQLQWQTVENAILSDDGTDPATGKHWLDFIDLDSWVRKYLTEEIFGNGDAGALSQYFYFDGENPDNKIFAGPVWDYDYSMGGDSIWLRPYTQYYTMNRAYVMEGVYAPWYPALYKQDIFYNRIKELYASEFLPRVERLIETDLCSYREKMLTAARADSIRWGTAKDSVVLELEYITSFLQDRTAFLSDVWLNETVYHTVCVDLGRKIIHGNFAVKSGDRLPEFPSYEDIRGLGWYNADTGEPFDISQPIYEDVRIYVKKAETKLPLIHYLPVLALVGVLPLLSVFDRIRTKKNGRVRHDPAKTR